MWWQPLLDFVKTIWPSIVGAVKLIVAAKVGQAVASGKAVERELEAVKDAADAVSRNKSRPVDERLRDARERGLYRVSNKPSKSE